jgi:hypothetical protein
VHWKCFSQEHRPQLDYSGFGPFVFDSDQYKKTILKLQADLSGLTTTAGQSKE